LLMMYSVKPFSSTLAGLHAMKSIAKNTVVIKKKCLSNIVKLLYINTIIVLDMFIFAKF
jgi:hypothetical protein